MDPVPHQQMDLRHGLANLQANDPDQALQEENLVAPEPLPEDNDEPALEYLSENVGVATTMSYMGQKTLA